MRLIRSCHHICITRSPLLLLKKEMGLSSPSFIFAWSLLAVHTAWKPPTPIVTCCQSQSILCHHTSLTLRTKGVYPFFAHVLPKAQGTGTLDIVWLSSNTPLPCYAIALAKSTSLLSTCTISWKLGDQEPSPSHKLLTSPLPSGLSSVGEGVGTFFVP